METFHCLNDICRLCLSNKSRDKFKIFFKIDDSTKNKFENVTQIELPISNMYPTDICSECSDHLENFHFYKHQLVRKQNELLQYLKIDPESTTKSFQEEIITEELFDDDYQMLESVIESEGEEIEEYEIDEETEALQNDSDDSQTEQYILIEDGETSKIRVPRSEEIKYEKIKPQLVLTPDFLKARDALKTHSADSKENEESAEYLAATMISNSEEKVVFICSDGKCKAVFASENEMKLHLDDHNRIETKLIQCEQCRMSFKKRVFYEKHLENVHNGMHFICQICGKTMESRIKYRSHIRNHDQTLKYKCKFEGCDKAFRVKHHLENHTRSHTKDSPFECTFEGCSSKFRQKYALTLHYRKHNQEFVNCDSCKSPFVSQFQLNKHLDKCNGIYKPLVTRATPKIRRDIAPSGIFKCSIKNCDESYKAKITLEKHLTSKHKIEVTPSFCVLCCQEFETPQTLKSHLRNHLPFSCSLCSTNFKTEENLKNHTMKSHEKNELRQHSCQHCTASFKRAEHLRTHIAYKHDYTTLVSDSR